MKKIKSIDDLLELSVPLLAGLVTALIFANVFPEIYQFIVYRDLFGVLSLHTFVNDVFMTFFFAIVTVEILHSLKPGGDLYPIGAAINPLVSACGGVLFPAIIYLGLNSIFGSDLYAHGWAIPTATDIALAWLAMRFIYGTKQHPAVKFLLVLAIADDAIGLVIIAIFYPDPSHPVNPIYLLLVLVGMAVSYMLRRFKVNIYPPYILIGGLLSWLGLWLAHLHPALALCFIVPFIPDGRSESNDEATDDCTHKKNPLLAFEHRWKTIVDVGLFFFGFACAGVQFSEFNVVTVIVLLSFFLGKPLGIFTFSVLASCVGLKRPKGIGLRDLVMIGIVAGIGLTVALFFCESAFAVHPHIMGGAKMGALLSISMSIIGWLANKYIIKVNKHN